MAPAISLRENERGTQIGNGWDPQWHQPTDLFTTYNEKDFRLGLNAAQTTLAATAQLAGATVKREGFRPGRTNLRSAEFKGAEQSGENRLSARRAGFAEGSAC